MADYKVTDTELTSVANKIRTKGGTQAQLEWPTGYVSAIDAISGSATLVTKSITQNGTYDPVNDNADGYSEVTVNVSGGSGSQYYENQDGSIGVQDFGTYVKWFFNGVDVPDNGISITDPVLSQYVPAGVPSVYYPIVTKAYSNDKTTHVGDLIFYSERLKLLSTDHNRWISGNDLYGVMYIMRYSALTTIGGAENDVQLNDYEVPPNN